MARVRKTLVHALATVAVAIIGVSVTPSSASAGKPKSSCTYTVAKGDTLSRIARRKGVTEKALIRANPALKKNPNRLGVGQSLKICAAKRMLNSRPSSCAGGGKLITHTVKKGQTVAGIAARYSVTRDSVRQYNKRLKKRTNSMIRVGESLRICTKNRRYTNRSWLKDGVQLQPGEGYNVRRPHNAWGTPAAVQGITAAIQAYRSGQPDAPLVQIGDISQANGGPLGGHLSHQDGRDVDVGFVFDPPVEGSKRKTIDLARSWALVKSFVDSGDLAAVFIDYRLQRRLYDHALAAGEEAAVLDRIFEYPRNGEREAVIYHWPGHSRHFHVRFKRVPKPTKPAS